MISASKVKANGLMIKPESISVTMKFGCRTKMLITPEMGAGLTACQVIYLKPGDTYAVHAHPISEDVTIVFQGKGEAFTGDAWYEVGEGEVIFSPEFVKHGLRNPSSSKEEMICYNWQAPYLSKFDLLPGAADIMYSSENDRVIKKKNRGKFDIRIPETGFIEHMDRGALFTGYGAPMRFIVWNGMGARKISLHRAFHPPGMDFKTHIHPDAEDTILAFRGNGEGFLVDKWHTMNQGDVLFAPRGIKHGTRNPDKNAKEPFICTGAAAPPQMDLYKLAGYL